MSSYLRSTVLALALALPAVANAAAVTYSDETSFQGAAGTLTTEGFNGVFSGSDFDFGPFSVNSSTGSFFRLGFASLVSEGSHALSFREDTVLTLVFDAAIKAISFDINEYNRGAMSYSDNAGNHFANAVLPNGAGSTFFGLTSDVGFTSVSLSFAGGSNGSLAGLDNLQFAQDLQSAQQPNTVPLPAGLPLLAAGLAGFGLLRRRAKTAA